MKAKYRPLGNKIEFEVDASTEKEIFKAIAKLSEVFGAEDKCGMCKKTNISFRVRTVKDDDYYELYCQDCGASFAFGQHKKAMTLYPKRFDKDKKPLPNHGWAKYRKATPEGEE
jgi:transcription elongation factor Elf1